MRIKNFTSGAVAVLCLAGLIRIVGFVSGAATPIHLDSSPNPVHEWTDLQEKLLNHGFPVRNPRPFLLTLETPPTQPALLREAIAVRTTLAGLVPPAPGLNVHLWRPDGHDVIVCVADGTRWDLETDGRPLVESLQGTPPRPLSFRPGVYRLGAYRPEFRPIPPRPGTGPGPAVTATARGAASEPRPRDQPVSGQPADDPRGLR